MSTAVATATGASPAVEPFFGDFILQFSSAGAFVLDVQVGSGSVFNDLYYDSSTKVTIDSSSGPRHVKVSGGMSYRMNVTTYNSPITMSLHRSSGN